MGGGGGAVRFRRGSHPRYIFCTEVQSKVAENPLTIHKISAALTRVTPEVTKLPSLLPLIRQRIIKSEVKFVHPMSVF